ncbi:MAG: hypothetical protein JXQ75_19705 [Phycisphaerae bacterium]|nr:hypothetical protein [Phycisphaerae bacterium]
MRKAFIEFLAARGAIPAERLDQLSTLLRGAPEPIGSIAFSYGMITGGDIDLILDEQRNNYKPFGEIAMDKGMLTQEQVEALLQVQQMRAAMHVAEALALSRISSIEQMMAELSQFFSQQRLSPVCCWR